ncbi:deoxyribodipyrimidine photolyase [Lewinellaceae bacterium SD302]|nr:deoxyribodipyrimidine photolyase [Lewinellaceae bacterium SD302]
MTIFWHRRDLRTHDNAGLYRALRNETDVLPIFIFDKNILDRLENKADARVEFLQNEVSRLANEYREAGGAMRVFYGKPLQIWKKLLEEYPEIEAVYTNEDYEQYAKDRDFKVAKLVEGRGGRFRAYKDHVIFAGDEIQKKAGGPYTVFTPYMRTWRAKLDERISTMVNDEGKELKVSFYLKPYPNRKYFNALAPTSKFGKKELVVPSLQDMGFEPGNIDIPPTEVSRELIKNYDETRDIPGIEGTSRLGIHYRHGTVSIREKCLRAMKLNDTYVNELIWRDFYSQILQHFPHVENGPFREKYDAIPWINDEDHFQAWCAGKTGVPIVDAGMRELNETGYMHNRVRMIVASYLTKHLLTTWQWGEAYFAEKLLDFELASNNGGWQWAAGCGTDAQPYFRVFNPESQQKKFDPEFKYIKEWVPEYGTADYPEPLVEHKFGRERAIATYKEALNGN